MMARCPSVTSVILQTLAERVRAMEVVGQQHAKLAALGKLAAGLAHELNNPAAGGRRAAQQLRHAFDQLHATGGDLNRVDGGETVGAVFAELQQDILAGVRASLPLDPLIRSDRESEVGDWLDSHEIEDGWNMAPALVAAGVDTAWLEATLGRISPDALEAVLIGLAATADIIRLLDQVETSTARIADLVAAVKAYTYMDQGPIQEVDLRRALSDTLTVMRHELGDGITVTQEYAPDLPSIEAYGAELNQVWTNLIDNAIDALSGNGQLRIQAIRERDYVVVEIVDDGPGIPQEIQHRIFEPFFTTKEVGQGTGLGLDLVYQTVVRRHNGDIQVDSRPGQTRFHIRLPINQGARE
jgi:signal transduction histidine kinase